MSLTVNEQAYDEDVISDWNMFPFLAVLSCVIGVVLLLLIGGAASLGLYDPAEAAALIEVRKQHQALVEQVQQLSEQHEELQAELAGVQAVVQQRREALAALQQQQRDLQAQLDQARNDVIETVNEISRKKEELAALERAFDVAMTAQRRKQLRDVAASIQDLRERLIALHDHRMEMEQKLADFAEEKRKWLRAIETPTVTLPRKTHPRFGRPVYLEVRADALVLHNAAAGLAPQRTDWTNAGGVPQLAERLAAFTLQSAKPHYLVLLVRPDAVQTFRHLQKRLSELRVPVACEPVDAGWQLRMEQHDGR